MELVSSWFESLFWMEQSFIFQNGRNSSVSACVFFIFLSVFHIIFTWTGTNGKKFNGKNVKHGWYYILMALICGLLNTLNRQIPENLCNGFLFWTILSEGMSDVKLWWGAWVCKQLRQLRKCIKKPINQSCAKKRSKLSTSSYQIYIESNRNQSSHSLPSNATHHLWVDFFFALVYHFAFYFFNAISLEDYLRFSLVFVSVMSL